MHACIGLVHAIRCVTDFYSIVKICSCKCKYTSLVTSALASF